MTCTSKTSVSASKTGFIGSSYIRAQGIHLKATNTPSIFFLRLWIPPLLLYVIPFQLEEGYSYLSNRRQLYHLTATALPLIVHGIKGSDQVSTFTTGGHPYQKDSKISTTVSETSNRLSSQLVFLKRQVLHAQ